MKAQTVFCLDNKREFIFLASSPYEAMRKMLYTLNLSHQDKEVKVSLTKSGLHWTMDHCGKTYSIRAQ